MSLPDFWSINQKNTCPWHRIDFMNHKNFQEKEPCSRCRTVRPKQQQSHLDDDIILLMSGVIFKVQRVHFPLLGWLTWVYVCWNSCSSSLKVCQSTQSIRIVTVKVWGHWAARLKQDGWLRKHGDTNAKQSYTVLNKLTHVVSHVNGHKVTTSILTHIYVLFTTYNSSIRPHWWLRNHPPHPTTPGRAGMCLISQELAHRRETSFECSLAPGHFKDFHGLWWVVLLVLCFPWFIQI